MANPGTIVIALGGNALAPAGTSATIHEQFRHTRTSLAAVVALAHEGWHIAIVHGNGPQVGDALERNERAMPAVSPLPLGVLVAATAGWIGYMIQQSLQNALRAAGLHRDVLTVITQTEVEPRDPELARPTKPIGHALEPEQTAALGARGVAVGRDGRGRWRRLAPSPVPVNVVEAEAVRQLVDEGKIVIAAGGGGPPVYADHHGAWEGVNAVVDKDRAAAILGHRIHADSLLILTDVDAVYRGWGTDAAEALRRLHPDEATALIESGECGVGMHSKVEAAVSFVRAGGRRSIIGHLEHGLEAMRGETGTVITEESGE